MIVLSVTVDKQYTMSSDNSYAHQENPNQDNALQILNRMNSHKVAHPQSLCSGASRGVSVQHVTIITDKTHPSRRRAPDLWKRFLLQLSEVRRRLLGVHEV